MLLNIYFIDYNLDVSIFICSWAEVYVTIYPEIIYCSINKNKVLSEMPIRKMYEFETNGVIKQNEITDATQEMLVELHSKQSF